MFIFADAIYDICSVKIKYLEREIISGSTSLRGSAQWPYSKKKKKNTLVNCCFKVEVDLEESIDSTKIKDN